MTVITDSTAENKLIIHLVICTEPPAVCVCTLRPPCHRGAFLLCRAVGVRVEVPPEDQFVNNGEIVSLLCNVSGSGPISYQWLEGGERLQDDVNISGSSASVLSFTALYSDFGEYQCNASNDVDYVLSEVAVVTGEGSGGCCRGILHIVETLAWAAVAVLMCR